MIEFTPFFQQDNPDKDQVLQLVNMCIPQSREKEIYKMNNKGGNYLCKLFLK